MERLFLEKYALSSEKAVNWLESRLTEDGSYGSEVRDLACYYKSPLLFYISGKAEAANRVLNYIKSRFMRSNGDFTTEGNTKSENVAFVEYWAYINAWIAIASQKMGRFDVAYPAYQYLTSFYHPHLGGFTTKKPYESGGKNLFSSQSFLLDSSSLNNHKSYESDGQNVLDVLTTAHLGLAALYFGDLEKAKNAGNLLQKIIAIQPDIKSRFYLRIDDNESLLTKFSEKIELFFNVSATQPNQAYFMIGYPIAFLGILYRATGDDICLKTGQKYLEFASKCSGIDSFHFSHKVAWGAAIIANLTKDIEDAKISTNIADYLLSIQAEDGAWFKDEPAYISFDQTAEIAIWLREISTELSGIRK